MYGAPNLEGLVAGEEERASRLFRIALEHDARGAAPREGVENPCKVISQSILMRRRNCWFSLQTNSISSWSGKYTLIDAHRPRFCVGLRILKCHVDLQLAELRAS